MDSLLFLVTNSSVFKKYFKAPLFGAISFFIPILIVFVISATDSFPKGQLVGKIIFVVSLFIPSVLTSFINIKLNRDFKFKSNFVSLLSYVFWGGIFSFVFFRLTRDDLGSDLKLELVLSGIFMGILLILSLFSYLILYVLKRSTKDSELLDSN